MRINIYLKTIILSEELLQAFDEVNENMEALFENFATQLNICEHEEMGIQEKYEAIQTVCLGLMNSIRSINTQLRYNIQNIGVIADTQSDIASILNDQ